MQRPNAALRAKLRRSLAAIGAIGAVGQRPLAASCPSAAAPPLLPPCLAVHVRHGDAARDVRDSLPIDRSLEAHLFHARNLTGGLGLSSVFILSDNRTVIETAPGAFPQFKWFAQQRPIRTNYNTFDYNNEVKYLHKLLIAFAPDTHPPSQKPH